MSRTILKLTELAQGVYAWRRASNGGIVPFNEVDQVTGLLLIDTGADDRAAEGLTQWIERCGARRVVIANTHRHRDHTWANAALIERGAVLLPGFPAVPPEPGGMIAHHLNSLQINSLALPGHTPDSRAVIARGVAFAGDAVYTPDILRRMPIPAYLDVERALASLDVLAEWLGSARSDPVPPGERWLVAGHGRPLQGAAALEAVAATRAAVAGALEALARVLGPPGYGPAAQPGDDAVDAWLETTGTAAQHAAAFATWRRVAGAYARELARRRAPSAR